MKHILKTTTYVLLAAAVLFGGISCKKATSDVARAVLATRTMIDFGAKDAEPVTITVYSDAKWTADIPSWITIDPTEGSGTVEVTITASDNYDGGAMGKPRKDTLVFHGDILPSRYSIVLAQEGDKYRDAPKVNVSDLSSIQDDAAVLLQESQVMALSTDGAILSDGKANTFAYGLQAQKVGDKLTASCTKSSTDGIPVLQSPESIQSQSGSAAQPQPTDISEGITAYEAKSIDYVFVKGTLKAAAGGGYNVVTEAGDAAFIYNPTDELKVPDLKGHDVELTGYSFGKKGSASVKVIATVLTDKGTPGPEPGTDPELPVIWNIGGDGYSYGETWPCKGNATVFGSTGIINSTTGSGTIWFNNAAGFAADAGAGEAYLDVGGKDPRVMGSWLGDYCEFRVPGEISAGRKVRISFECRSAKKGSKYWRLKYLDGEEYLDALSTSTVTVEGTEIVYTHEMLENDVNVQVTASVTYKAKTDGIVFRFECASNVLNNGKVATAPTGSWRLARTSYDSEEWQPTIQYDD